jgi:hypothetical protein
MRLDIFPDAVAPEHVRWALENWSSVHEEGSDLEELAMASLHQAISGYVAQGWDRPQATAYILSSARSTVARAKMLDHLKVSDE